MQTNDALGDCYILLCVLYDKPNIVCWKFTVNSVLLQQVIFSQYFLYMFMVEALYSKCQYLQYLQVHYEI